MAISTRRLLSRLAPASLLALAACAVMAEHTPVPPAIAVPGNPARALEALATGVQVYQCRAATGNPAQFQWVLRGPDATLYSTDGTLLGHHRMGPAWIANDGSRVVGAVSAQAPSPADQGVPWLLLAAKSHEGQGVFAHTAYIQRVKTMGGKAPGDGCDAAHAGREARVPYTATYDFFNAKP